MGLGSLDTLTLAEARERARECRLSLLDGVDPIDARQKRKADARAAAARMLTFKACAESYIAEHRKTWKNPIHANQWPTTLQTYVYPLIGSLPVASIDTAMVLKCLRPIWEKIPDSARRIRGRVEKVLDWAKAQSYRDGENPARWKGHLDHLLAATPKAERVQHHAALPYGELPAFAADLRARPQTGPRALEFLILTAARTNEVLGARWREIDFAEKLWIVPAARMKSGRAHIVPLSPRAIEILRAQQPGKPDALIFPGTRAGHTLSNMTLLELLRGMRPGFTVHGFRSTFRDWSGDRTNYQNEVIEAALAHVIVDETEAAYRRSTAVEKRRRLMADWAKFCNAAPTKSKVIPIRAAR
jgi:integrase